jgi:hypothetical protein
MTDVKAYPYAEGDLLEKPHSYFFSSYQGEEFVSAWASSRSECRTASGADSDSGDDLEAEGGSTRPFGTQKYFRELNALFAEPDFPQEDRKNLDSIVRNFEAKKRIYEDYDPGFTSKDRTDYMKLSLYVDFGALLVAAYDRWKALPYLNAMLKTLDILCAHRDMLTVADRLRMDELIDAEERFVSELAQKLSVKVL